MGYPYMRRHWYAYVINADPSCVMTEEIIYQIVCLFIDHRKKQTSVSIMVTLYSTILCLLRLYIQTI